MKKRYFDDLKDGERLHCQPVRMTRQAIIDFGKKFDPQQFHVDENAARESLFGGLVASSLHTLAACTRVVVDAQGSVAILSVAVLLDIFIQVFETRSTAPLTHLRVLRVCFAER